MIASNLQLIWANKPGCGKAVAEFWIGENDLWFTLYLDDNDKSLKVEVFPSAPARTMHVIDFKELDHLVESAKYELLAMADSTAVTV